MVQGGGRFSWRRGVALRGIIVEETGACRSGPWMVSFIVSDHRRCGWPALLPSLLCWPKETPSALLPPNNQKLVPTELDADWLVCHHRSFAIYHSGLNNKIELKLLLCITGNSSSYPCRCIGCTNNPPIIM